MRRREGNGEADRAEISAFLSKGSGRKTSEEDNGK
jgi:hypothetical protein